MSDDQYWFTTRRPFGCFENSFGSPITVTLDGGEGFEPLDLSHGAERKKSRLKLAANGFAFFATSELKVAFGGRRRRP